MSSLSFTEDDCEACWNDGKSYCNHGHSSGCCCSECIADITCHCCEPVRDRHGKGWDWCSQCGFLLYEDDPIYEECARCCKIVESINDDEICEECGRAKDE